MAEQCFQGKKRRISFQEKARHPTDSLGKWEGVSRGERDLFSRRGGRLLEGKERYGLPMLQRLDLSEPKEARKGGGGCLNVCALDDIQRKPPRLFPSPKGKRRENGHKVVVQHSGGRKRTAPPCTVNRGEL